MIQYICIRSWTFRQKKKEEIKRKYSRENVKTILLTRNQCIKFTKSIKFELIS